MAAGNKVGYVLATKGVLTDIDGPTTVATSNGLGQRNELGARVFDDNGNEYIYLKGVASTAAGDWVSFVPGTFQTARLVSNTAISAQVAVAMAATVADCWGWYQIYGLTPAYTAIATDASADGKALSMGASADGRATTGATTTKNIFGATAVGASASNVGTAAIVYPWMFGSATI